MGKRRSQFSGFYPQMMSDNGSSLFLWLSLTKFELLLERELGSSVKHRYLKSAMMKNIQNDNLNKLSY